MIETLASRPAGARVIRGIRDKSPAAGREPGRRHHRSAVLRQHLLRRPVGLLLRLAQAQRRLPLPGRPRRSADAEAQRGRGRSVPSPRRKDEARAFYEQTDGRRVRRGAPSAQARRAAGLHLRAQDHSRLGHSGGGPSHRRVHDHRSVAAGHRDARAVSEARAPQASHRRSSWSRASATPTQVWAARPTLWPNSTRSSPSGSSGSSSSA